jgi:ribosomal protein S18 acetylase RimI-like enzyme
MTIRRGTSKDLAVVQKLNQQLFFHEHDEHFYEGDTYNLNWPYEEDGIKYFKDCLGENPASGLFLAEVEDVAVGYLACSQFTRTYRIPARVGYLDNMYVSPEFRNLGLGSALIDAFKDWSAANGAGLIRVSAMAKNASAQRFYQRNGFTHQEVTLEQPIGRVTEG